MIVIIGAGISGLTCALELAKKGFQVSVYEKDIIAGGMAKSYLKNDIPTEHSWRGYMSFYHNVFDILKQLNCSNNKSIHDVFEKEYTIEDVKIHNKSNDAWIIFRGYVYDITYFINKHPGGSLINLTLGEDVEKIWEKYLVSWHLNHNDIIETLTKNKMGKLKIKKESIDNFNCKNTLQPITMDKLYNEHKKYEKINLLNQSIKLIYHYAKFFCGNLRNEIAYQTPFIDIMNKNNPLYDHFITYVAGPGLGVDFNTVSIGTIFFYINGYIKNLHHINSWFVTNKPTFETFIDPMVELIKSYGVNIYYKSTLEKINVKNNKISSVIINGNEIIADEYIIAINPNMISDILIKSNENKDFNDLIKLHDELKTINNQISFRLGFNKKINFDELNHGYVLMDSINNITFYSQDEFIKNKDNIKSLWSGTCVQVNNNNINKEQFIKGIIEQFINCSDLQKQIKKNNGFCLKKSDIIYSEIFDEWTDDNENNKMISKYPKFVNTFANEKYKPNHKTNFDNLYLTGAHTNTSFKIWSMESACESGKIVTNFILQKYNKPFTYVYTHDQLYISKLISKIDDLLYKNSYPSIVDYVILVLCIIIIFRIIKKL
jgi:uncharacterized protein with NAD-binding domain and iron-sulfur cluster